MEPISTASAIQTGVGLAQSVLGLINSGKAKKEAEQLEKTRPKRSISPYAKDELSLAESELASGMGAEAKQAFQEGIDRSLSSSLGATLKYGGGVNMVGQLYDQSVQGQQRLAALEENIRLNQVSNVIQAYRNMTNELDTNFQFNEFAPWADKAQANAQARQQSANMVMSGVDTATSGAMSFWEDQNAKRDYRKALESATDYYTPFSRRTPEQTIGMPRMDVIRAFPQVDVTRIGAPRPMNLQPIDFSQYISRPADYAFGG